MLWSISDNFDEISMTAYENKWNFHLSMILLLVCFNYIYIRVFIFNFVLLTGIIYININSVAQCITDNSTTHFNYIWHFYIIFIPIKYPNILKLVIEMFSIFRAMPLVCKYIIYMLPWSYVICQICKYVSLIITVKSYFI